MNIAGLTARYFFAFENNLRVSRGLQHFLVQGPLHFAPVFIVDVIGHRQRSGLDPDLEIFKR
jgi:hypothetical protein